MPVDEHIPRATSAFPGNANEMPKTVVDFNVGYYFLPVDVYHESEKLRYGYFSDNYSYWSFFQKKHSLTHYSRLK